MNYPGYSGRRWRPQSVSFLASILLVALGSAVLVGWMFDTQWLKSISPDWAKMKPNTALCFILAGVALWCLQDEQSQIRARLAGLASAATIAFIALLTLGEHLFGANLGIDELLFRDSGTAIPGPSPLRMSLAATVCFLLLSLSLLGLDRRTCGGHRPTLALALALLAGLIGLLAFAGYLYGAKSLYAVSPFAKMALHTAVLFVVAAAGILCARPDEGPLSILAAQGTGSTMARRVLPLAIVTPLLLGWLRLQGERAGLYGLEFGLALFAISNVVIFGALTWLTAVWLNRGDTERQQSDQALRESTERLAVAVEASDIGLWDRDLDTNEIYFSPEWKRQIGYTDAELPNRFHEWKSRVHPDDLPTVIARIQAYIETTTQTGIESEYRLRHKDGSYRWVYARARLVSNASGRPARLLGCHVDVTARKLAEETLRRSEQRYRLAASTGQVWDWNIVANTVSFPPEFWRRLGYEMPEPADTVARFASILHPADRERWRQAVKDHLSRRLPYELEFRVYAKSGEYLWLHTRGQAVWAEDGRATFMAGTTFDITERKRAEESLRASEANFARAQSIAHLGSWEFTLATGHLHWSDEIYRIFGITPSEFDATDEAYLTAVHPEDQDQIREAVRRAVAGDARLDVEHRVVRPDGSMRWVQVLGELEHDETGQPFRLTGAVLDITGRKRAEDEIRQLNTDLERRVAARTAELLAKNKELETFSYSVSHDLKAPLRGIDGYSRLLLTDYADKLDDEGRGFLHNVRSATSQMQQLIDDLLAYSKLERRALSMNRIDLQALVETVLKERALDLKPVQLEVAISAEPVHADRDGLTMALRNLIDNAVKFSCSRQPPVIEIRSRVEDDRYILSVRDNGSGFDMKYHDRIFQIFQRLHRAEEYSGTGIGLAIVQKVMERIGGRVRAESTVGEGAIFYLDLPREKSAG